MAERGGTELKFEYREGTVEEITDHVSDHASEIGIVYLAKSQLPSAIHFKKEHFWERLEMYGELWSIPAALNTAASCCTRQPLWG